MSNISDDFRQLDFQPSKGKFKVKPAKGMTFIPLETWTKPNGVHRAVAHAMSFAEAFRIAKAEADKNIDIPIRMRELLSKYPNMSPDMTAAFAKLGIEKNTPAAELAARYDSISKQVGGFDGTKAADPATVFTALDMLGKTPDNADHKDVNDSRFFAGFKKFTRTATATMFAPLQAVTQYARLYARNIEQAKEGNRDWFTALAPTTALANKSLYQNSIGYQMLQGKESGEGFFPGYDSTAVQASEKIARDTLTVKGHNDLAWTFGRQVADIFFDPEDTAFRTMSGLVDAFVASVADPFIIAGRIGTARRAKNAAEGAVSAVNSSRIAMADADLAARQAKRVEDAKRLVETLDNDVTTLKDTIAQDLIVRHELSVAGKGTISMKEAIDAGNKYGIPVLQKEYEDAVATIDSINAIKSAPDVIAAAKAAGMRPRAGATVDDVLKTLDRKYKTALKSKRVANENLVNTMSKVYGKDVEPQMLLLEQAKAKYLETSTYRQRLSEQMKNIDKARNIVESHRAGVKVLPDEAIFERGKAVEWFAGPNAQHILQAIADTDNAALINRLSKGKFGAELSQDLAMAKTVTEVEDALLPRLGLTVDTMIPASRGGRYIVSRFPNLVMRGANSTRLNAAYDKLNTVFKHPFTRMPNGRYMHFEDTETLAEQTTRWMSSAGYSLDEIDDVFNRLVATDSKDILSRRNIVLGMLNNTINKIADAENLSKASKQRITEHLRSYGNNLFNEGKYHSEKTGSSSGFSVILDHGEEVDLTGTPLSVSQLAMGIRLPDVTEIQRSMGNIARAARAIDRKVGDGTMTEDVARATMRTIRGANNIFKTMMLVFRVAFVARDIMECIIRQYISGSRNIVSNPRTMLATIVSNPVGSRTLLAKMDGLLGQKYDPFLVDATGNAFHAQKYTPGLDQEFMSSHQRMMATRAVSSDGRVLSHGIRPDAEWFPMPLADNKGNLTRYSDALAGVILRHYADPIRRTLAPWIVDSSAKVLRKRMQALVDSGKITFEDAVSRMVKENKFRGVEMLRNSTPEMRRVLESTKGRKQFLFDHDNSIKNQLSHDTLGMSTLLDFIGTGKMVDDKGNVLFAIGQDYAKNHKQLSKYIRQNLIENDEMAKRAMDVAIPAPKYDGDTREIMKKAVDSFFEVAARATTRTIYSPEYRVKYWETVADYAPLLSQKTAEKLLSSSFAKEIVATKVVDAATGKPVNYASHNPAFNNIVKTAEGKSKGGFLSVDEIHEIASSKASQHVANLFYDAAEKNNLTHAASLAMPFVNAWQNTIRTWGKYSISPTRAATRVLPFARMMQTLQSPGSRAIYELTGTPTDATDPSEGFIYTDQNGNKKFTVPFSGNAVTAFGLLGNPSMANIGINLQSLNLAFSGGSLPGSDVGVAPGVGPLITIGYRRLTPQSWKYAMPGFVRDMIEPYGPQKTSSILEDFFPGWLKTFVFATDQGQITKMSKGVMGWLASTDEKYASLYDQKTTMSSGDRSALQGDLAERSGLMATGMIMWQALVKSMSPGAPIYTFYQKAKGGQSMSQVQLAHAFNQIFDQVGGDYNVAFGQFADIFGPQAVMSMLSTSTAEVMGTSEAFDFARQNTDLMDKYAKELPYFFTGGDYSMHYASMLKAKGENNALSRNDLIREADAAMVAAMKGQLLVKASKYGYGPDWVDDEMARMKANLFPGYEPLRPKTASDRNNRIARVIEMSQDPRILETAAGQGLKDWLPMYVEVKKMATDAGYKSVGVDEFAAEREMLSQKAEEIAQTNPDFGNLYRRVFYYEING